MQNANLKSALKSSPDLRLGASRAPAAYISLPDQHVVAPSGEQKPGSALAQADAGRWYFASAALPNLG